MRLIHRPKQEPRGLTHLRSRYGNWTDVYPDSKIDGGRVKSTKQKERDEKDLQNLKTALAEMQNNRCAYCESRIDVNERARIDHFVPRKRNKSKEFEWSNLFLSCANKSSCDQFKADKDVGEILNVKIAGKWNESRFQRNGMAI